MKLFLKASMSMSAESSDSASESWVRQRFPKVSRAVDDLSRERRETIDWDDLKHTLCCIYKRTTELRAMDLSDREVEAIIKSMLVVKFK